MEWKNGMKLTDEEFRAKLYEKYFDEYEILEKYINSKTKIKTRHNVCGYEWLKSPSDLLQGCGCPKCGKTMKKTNEIFLKDVFNLVESEYTVLGTYTNNSSKILFRHNECGFEYLIRPQNFLRGDRCPKCTNHYRRTQEEFCREVSSLTNNEYSVIGKFKNTATPINFKHSICGNEFMMTPNSFLNGGQRCPKCGIKNRGIKCRTTNDSFVKKVFELVGNEYTFLEDYKTEKTKIKVIHNTCNHSYDVQPSNFIQGFRCPKCASSKGEKLIDSYLSSSKIEYQRQFKISDCKNIKSLPFDFAIFRDKNLITLIEYDGQHHFKQVAIFENTSLKKTQHNDKIKNNYCKEHNIPLLRIPYTEFDNIEIILEKHLHELNLL